MITNRMLGVFELLPEPPQEITVRVAIETTANLIEHVFTIQLPSVRNPNEQRGPSRITRPPLGTMM